MELDPDSYSPPMSPLSPEPSGLEDYIPTCPLSPEPSDMEDYIPTCPLSPEPSGLEDYMPTFASVKPWAVVTATTTIPNEI